MPWFDVREKRVTGSVAICPAGRNPQPKRDFAGKAPKDRVPPTEWAFPNEIEPDSFAVDVSIPGKRA